MFCSKWDRERELLKEKIEDLQLTTIAKKICDDKETWKAFHRFAESTLSIKEEDERIRQRRALTSDEEN